MYVYNESKGHSTARVEYLEGEDEYQASITINGHTGHLKEFTDKDEAIEYAADLLKRAI